MRSSLAWYLSLSAALFVVTASATSALGDESSTEAERRHDEGVEAFNHWQFEKAREAFVQAYALDPQPKYLWDLALSEAKAGRPAEALAHFKQYFRRAPASAWDEHRAKAEPLMNDAEARTGHVRVTAPTGATILIDGAAIPELAPLEDTVDVMPGEHTIGVMLGTAKTSTTVAPRAGQTVRADLALEAPSAPRVAGVEPVAAPPSVPPDAKRSDGWSGRKTAGIAVAAAGLAGLGVGVGFEVASRSKAQDADRESAAMGPSACATQSTGACERLSADRDAQTRDHIIGIASLSLGGAAVAAGALMFFWPTPAASRWAIVPQLSHHEIGMQLRGEF